MRFLITGCGRSGTKYMATVLQTIGLDVGHERLGRDGAVSGIWTVESDSYPSFHQQGPRPHFDLVLHQVRHPLPTIGSVTTGSPESWEFNCRFIPATLKEPLLIRCAKYWLYWNRIAQEQATFTYRIENLKKVWIGLMRLLRTEASYDQIIHLSRSMNTREHPEVTWDVLEKNVPRPLVDEVKALGRSYGYAIR